MPLPPHSQPKRCRLVCDQRYRPKAGIIGRFNQLYVHAHGVAALLHASFQDVGDAKLPGDLRQIFRRAFVMLVDVREVTFRSAILDKRVRISSLMPSAK